MDFEILEQFLEFAKLGRLNKVAEKFMISTPSLSRNMKQLERDLGVELFDRTANRISLNQTGKKAVTEIKNIVETKNRSFENIKLFDQALKTIYISSCAPLPLWDLIPKLSEQFPSQTISNSINSIDKILESIEKNNTDLAILPFKIKNLESKKIYEEKLFISVKSNHPLAKLKEVSFDDINGYNFLLRDKLGFWDDLCRKKMDSSKFLVQKNKFEFDELTKNSSLPRFVTDKSPDFKEISKYQINIPIKDKEAKANFYLIFINKELIEKFKI